MGFTHVEFLPVAEHAFYPSWGYQVTGFYAPTSRYGTPDDFQFLVNALHEAGIGVIIDWVPAHFPRDDWALARFDGTALYEHEDPRKGAHQDWGTLIFNYGRHEVVNFLIANALFWCDRFHVDGLRVDAVASMLYLDYSRQARANGFPTNIGGRENLEAIEFLRKFNHLTHTEFPGRDDHRRGIHCLAAGDPPALPGRSGVFVQVEHGLDARHAGLFRPRPDLPQVSTRTISRSRCFIITTRISSCRSRMMKWCMAKRSLLGRMPGDDWQRFANLRALLAYQWLFPGKKLLFMGGEFGQSAEWNANGELDWWLLEAGPYHRGLQNCVRDLNALYRSEPGLWQGDYDLEGFRWIDCSDQDNCVMSFARQNADQSSEVVVVLNLTPYRATNTGLVSRVRANGWKP